MRDDTVGQTDGSEITFRPARRQDVARIVQLLADDPLGAGRERFEDPLPNDYYAAFDRIEASEGNILAVAERGFEGQVYNIGGNNEKANIQIVRIILEALGKPESLITYVTDRKGHDMRYAIDPTKIHNELGWLPETRFADGIKKTIQWYLDNRVWWETIISGEYQHYYEKMYGNRG